MFFSSSSFLHAHFPYRHHGHRHEEGGRHNYLSSSVTADKTPAPPSFALAPLFYHSEQLAIALRQQSPFVVRAVAFHRGSSCISMKVATVAAQCVQGNRDAFEVRRGHLRANPAPLHDVFLFILA